MKDDDILQHSAALSLVARRTNLAIDVLLSIQSDPSIEMTNENLPQMLYNADQCAKAIVEYFTICSDEAHQARIDWAIGVLKMSGLDESKEH